MLFYVWTDWWGFEKKDDHDPIKATSPIEAAKELARILYEEGSLGPEDLMRVFVSPKGSEKKYTYNISVFLPDPIFKAKRV